MALLSVLTFIAGNEQQFADLTLTLLLGICSVLAMLALLCSLYHLAAILVWTFALRKVPIARIIGALLAGGLSSALYLAAEAVSSFVSGAGV